MPFYWSINSVPELAALPKARRREIWKECYRLRPLPWWYWPIFMGGFIAVYLMVDWLVPGRGRSHSVFVLRLPLIAASLGWGLGALVTHVKTARIMPEIRKHVGGLCLHCGYDLRATSDRCPECGTVILQKT